MKNVELLCLALRVPPARGFYTIGAERGGGALAAGDEFSRRGGFASGKVLATGIQFLIVSPEENQGIDVGLAPGCP
jgi:hypothetical protein